MVVLVTGAKGFVGSRLVNFLKKKGYEVLSFEGDMTKQEDIQNFSANRKIEAVIHLAAVINAKKRVIFQKVNVEGTKRIIDLSRRLGAGRLIFLSSIRILSAARDTYIDSKREAEKIVVNSGLPYIILRPSMVYGPGDKKNIGFLLKLAKIMPMMPVFNFRMQPVFIDDLVKVISACLSVSASQTINIVGPEIITFADLLAHLKLLGFKFYKLNAPCFFSFLIKIFSFLPFFPLPRWQVKTLLADEIFEEHQWRELFKIKETPFIEGLSKTLML